MTAANDPRWRKVKRAKVIKGERTSVRGRTWSWRVTRTIVLILSCGHVQERRGICARTPKRVLCKECEVQE